ncbi:MAG: 50S ribosomal protein L11 methyltransferase, partial [Gallionella sp.]|nr:50S ribosomal protein L11 methyltransferase [Gallionella sp.]
LAIAALKLGSASAVGVDVDAQAVLSSRDNAVANQVGNVQFFLPNDAPKGEYDLVVANILTNPLRMLAPLLASATRQGGQIVLSGILDSQAEDVMAIYGQWFDLNPPVFEDGWTCLSGSKR